MKRKKRFIKTLVVLIYLIANAIPYMNWRNKANINDDFMAVVIHNTNVKKDSGSDYLYPYCNAVMQFTEANPIDIDYTLDCENLTNKADFFKQTGKISKKYRTPQMTAYWIFIGSQIVTLILLWWSRFLIDEKY